MVYVLTEEAIDVALAGDPRVKLLGSFVADNDVVDAICIKKTIYLPAP